MSLQEDLFLTFYSTDHGRRVLAELRNDAYDPDIVDPVARLTLINLYESIRKKAGITDELEVINLEAQVAACYEENVEEETDIMEIP